MVRLWTVVQLPVTGTTIFDDYANEVFVLHIMRQLETSMGQVPVYNSIKESTREKRGKGVRWKVAGQTKVSGNWPDFLRDPTREDCITRFPIREDCITTFPDGKQVFATSGASLVSVSYTHLTLPTILLL